VDFFDRVKAGVRARGTTIEAAAHAAGLSRDSYNAYKRKGNLPRADQAVAIARELGTSVEYLVTGEEPDTIPPTDRLFFDRARFYRQTIGDLDVLEPSVRDPLIGAIHGAAASARQLKESVLHAGGA
jgi:transcriptional regulator with XRE-family HTH domain